MDVIKDERIDKLKFILDYLENKKMIWKERCPEYIATANLYKDQKVSQCDFKFISEYFKIIRNPLEDYSMNVQCSKAEYQRRLEEIFFRGLGQNTRSYLIDKNIEGIYNIFEELKRVEKRLL